MKHSDFLSPISVPSKNDDGIGSTSVLIIEVETTLLSKRNQPCIECFAPQECGNSEDIFIIIYWSTCKWLWHGIKSFNSINISTT